MPGARHAVSSASGKVLLHLLAAYRLQVVAAQYDEIAIFCGVLRAFSRRAFSVDPAGAGGWV